MFAFGLRGLLGFWEVFVLAAAIQVIASFVYSSIKISKEQAIIDVYQEEMDTLLDMSTVTVECPCGKNKFDANVFTAIENIFECDVCGSKFKSDITITPTLLTEPISTNTSFDDLIQNQKEL
jgi:hypothetical protein